MFAASALGGRALPPGSTAPEFKGVDSNGVQHSLSDYRGKFVVLEWHNQGCPYEQKHYLSGNIESLQKQWTSKGVVWLSILSSAPGQQGYGTPAEENTYLKKMNASPTAALLDLSGAIGICTTRTRRRTCSSSIRPGRSCTRGRWTTSRRLARPA